MNENFSLGTRLQMLRKERRLSQRDLARCAGLSINSISLIERDQISPNVATLQRLASALSVKMACFFDTDEHVRVIHAKAGERASLVGTGLTIEGIGARLIGQQMELLLLTLSPGSDTGNSPVVHTGHELALCVRGLVQYEVSNSRYLLGPGDILLFEATLPHCSRNPGEEEAQIVLVLQASDEPQDSAWHHFRYHPSVAHLG